MSEPERNEEKTDVQPASEPASDRMEDLLHVDPLELEIGYRLIGLADPTRGGDLLAGSGPSASGWLATWV